jgi:hypothetical protein
MQLQSIPKPAKQKAQDMGLSDLRKEEFKLFAMEYNTTNTEPDKKLDHYVNTFNRAMKTMTQESMTCSSITWIQNFTPCKCKTPT